MALFSFFQFTKPSSFSRLYKWSFWSLGDYRNIMQSCQEQTQSGWLVLEVKFMYRTFICYLNRSHISPSFCYFMHLGSKFLTGNSKQTLCSFLWMLNTVGLLVKEATAFAVASHLINLTIFFFYPLVVLSHFTAVQNNCFICTWRNNATVFLVLLVGIPSVPSELPSRQEAWASPGFLHFSAELWSTNWTRVCPGDDAVCYYIVSNRMYLIMIIFNYTATFLTTYVSMEQWCVLLH